MSKKKEEPTNNEAILRFIEHRQRQKLIGSINYLKFRDRAKNPYQPLPISYNPITRILTLEGKNFDFSASKQAQGLLTMLFSDRTNLTTPTSYVKFLYRYNKLLSDHGIETNDQIRGAKRFIQNKVQLKDLFPHDGFLIVNSKYL